MKNKERRENRQTFYDERQLIEQGKSYEMGFVCAVLLLTIFYFLYRIADITLSAPFVIIVCLTISVTVCEMRMILTDSWVTSERPKEYLVFCFIWVLLLVLVVIVPIIKKPNLIEFLIDVATDPTNAYAFAPAVALNRTVTYVTYYIKLYCDKKKLKAEEEENKEE